MGWVAVMTDRNAWASIVKTVQRRHGAVRAMAFS
jgi:hypothetical protein